MNEPINVSDDTQIVDTPVETPPDTPTDTTPPDTTQDDVSQDVPDDVTIPEFKFDDKVIPYDELTNIVKDFNNDSNWKAANDQRSKEIQAERRQFEAERRAFEQERQQFQREPKQPETTPEIAIPEDIENDPALKSMYTAIQALQKENQELKQGFQSNEFERETQAKHAEMQGKYQNYDRAAVEDSIIRGDQFENAHLANQWRALQNGGSDALLNILPEDVKKTLIQQGRDSMLADLRKKQNLRNNVKTPQATRQALTKLPVEGPKNYREAREQSLAAVRESGLNLFEE